MGRKGLKGLVILSMASAAAYSTYKAAKEWIEYKKIKNKDIYINSDMFDISDMMPVIRKSICNGEMEAGFKDRNGKFTSYMLIKSEKDIEEFRKKYHITGEIPTEY